MPRIIPVIDVLDGVVVRAVGGRRHEYRPVESRLTRSTEPIEVARALRDATGSSEVYVADLDAITGTAEPVVPSWAGDRVWFDGGFRTAEQPRRASKTPGVRPVIGSETAGPQLVQSGGHDAIVSIDLRDGVLLGDWRAWGLAGPRDAVGLAGRAVGMGVRTLIVLDLARVGIGNGPGALDLIRSIRTAHPEVELIAGGGVRDRADLDRLGAAGADAVLVASALHDGTLTFPRPKP